MQRAKKHKIFDCGALALRALRALRAKKTNYFVKKTDY